MLFVSAIAVAVAVPVPPRPLALLAVEHIGVVDAEALAGEELAEERHHLRVGRREVEQEGAVAERSELGHVALRRPRAVGRQGVGAGPEEPNVGHEGARRHVEEALAHLWRVALGGVVGQLL